ncbi:hypothetical protein Dsin_003632 [Dipteronia sinensis]|uniref:Aldehyde oxidase GLOX n=1 Tax=Dipteronia sinensis TaxID=43782 RepID=A0AAE0B8G2_9ROSI|nr:hypothetical protein Dsin_003632 [Dipteronia sinensis]
MTSQTSILYFLLFQLIIIVSHPCHRFLTHAAGGRWQFLQRSIGISAMHMQLLNNDRVIMFDRTDFGKSNISLPDGKCRKDSTGNKVDCTAHSVEYDVLSNTFRPLMVQSNVWCSSGAVMPDGSLIQTGGYKEGDRRIRIFKPCSECDWVEVENGLAVTRWYATNHILPEGRQIVIGGTMQFNYEFIPKNGDPILYSLPFLAQTSDRGVENNLYPFVFLIGDGNLFIFANNRAILFDYSNSEVVKNYPTTPGGDPRCYPSTGSAVLLPLKNLQASSVEAEVLVCGGATKGSVAQAKKGIFVNALDTCGRIKITDTNPQWVMETMPQARVMGDMILLPNGNVLIINGGAAGVAGWELGRNPVLNPVLYRPDDKLGSRFELQNPTTIPRMYHSTALLLRDGRVLVGGSNPHNYYNFTGVLYPTELSLEAFSPAYLNPENSSLRPKIVLPASYAKLNYNQNLEVRFTVARTVALDKLSVTMVAPSFTTHSFSMNHRLLVLGSEKVIGIGNNTYAVQVTTPGSGGVLRDLNGKGACLFSSFIGILDSNTAELMAIWKACALCASRRDLKGTKISIANNFKVAVSWILNEDFGSFKHVKTIYDIRSMLCSLGNMDVVFNSRATNSFADMLAKKGSGSSNKNDVPEINSLLGLVSAHNYHRLLTMQTVNDRRNRIRIIKPCSDNECDWVEFENVLAVKRWYATNHILSDGRQIVIGGIDQFKYEFLLKKGAPNLYTLPFLKETRDTPNIQNNLYPYVFLIGDGNLFIFANNRSILFDYSNSNVVKTYPDMPSGDPRCYPSTGSAVLLPLKNLQAPFVEAEVLVCCGGSPKGSAAKAKNKKKSYICRSIGYLRAHQNN